MFVRRFLVGLVALALICAAAAPSSALAAGGSAADSQYVDPLAPTTSATKPATPANSGTTAATTANPAASRPRPIAPTVATAPASAPPTLTRHAPASITSDPRSLPKTGIDVGLIGLAGLTMLGAGVVIRRCTTRPGLPGPGR